LYEKNVSIKLSYDFLNVGIIEAIKVQTSWNRIICTALTLERPERKESKAKIATATDE